MEQSNQPPANSLESEPGTEPQTPQAEQPTDGKDSKPKKQPNALKKFLKKFNLYFLLFIFICLVAGAVTVVSYLNSKKEAPKDAIANQQLSQDTVNQLTNSDATVGGSGQTLTVNGNAIFSGQVLVKGDVGVAGSIVANGVRSSAEITAPQMTVSGRSGLNEVQATSLQVSGNTTLQGPLTLQRDLNVAGTSSFSGPVTIGQLSVNNLTLTGNSTLRVLNHISFPGASPGRTVNATALGGGGTSSVSGSDTSGSVSINTGVSPAAGCFTTLTFAQKFTTAPRVIISPVGPAAGSLQYYVNRDINGFSVCTNTAAAANTVFSFDYFVAQ